MKYFLKMGVFFVGILPFFFSFSSVAQDEKETAEQAARLTREIEERVGRIFQECPFQIQTAGFSEPCEDLFGAACLKSDAKLDELFQLKKEAGKIIDSAYDVTVQAMGKPSLEKAYFDYLDEKGLEVKPDLSEELKQELLSKTWLSKGFSQYVTVKDFPKYCFEATEDLETEFRALEQQGERGGTVPAPVPSYEKLYEKYKDAPLAFFNKKSRWYQDDVVQLYNDILNECESMQNTISEPQDSVSVPFPTECSEPYRYQMRSRLMDVLRKKDSPQEKVAKIAFITKELDVLIKLMAHDVEKRMEPQEETASPVEKVKRKISFLIKRTQDACDGSQGLAQNMLRNYRRLFFKNLNAAKPMVESLMDQTFSESHKVKTHSLYDQVKTTLVEVVRDLFGSRPELKDSAKYQKMMTGLQALPLRWPQKPSSDLYKTKEGFPLPVLDFEKVPPKDQIVQSFQDPTLNDLRQINAYYNTYEKDAELELEEAVNILPAITLLSDKNPLAMMEILAHEAGHKISYEGSQWNGYDLRPTYKKLIECLRRPNSVGLQEGQEDEATADWLASHVMGRVIEKFFPKEQRKQAVLNMAGFYCEVAKEEDEFYKPIYEGDTEARHLEGMSRLNGIFGAQSKIREHLGCDPTKKYKFSECTLDGVRK
ncbi:MAG: hypothetical protein HYY62_00970 [Deltaproteobacteria bacterium]|nr:hypothetical protein [Deltaproteobacteria bacterium]